MHAECVRRTGARTPLVVGDRLDTDIEGGRRAGAPSLLVFSGVTTPTSLLAAGPEHRPDLIADDVAGLGRAHPSVVQDGDGWRCGAWTATAGAEESLALTVTGDTADDDGLDGLRALCVAHWARHRHDGAAPTVQPGQGAVSEALTRWGLAG
jgi:hypothetical protein